MIKWYKITLFYLSAILIHKKDDKCTTYYIRNQTLERQLKSENQILELKVKSERGLRLSTEEQLNQVYIIYIV